MMRRCNFLIAVRWPVKSLLHYQQSSRAFFFKHLKPFTQEKRRADTTAPTPPHPHFHLTPENEQGLGRNGMKERDLGGGEVTLADPTFSGDSFFTGTRRASYSYTGV